MVKTFKNLLLQNQKSYDLETWHVALGTQALQSLYKWWPCVDLDLFYGKVKLGHLYVWMGKTVIKSFNGGKHAAKDSIDWIILLMKNIWPQWVVCPCPGSIYIMTTTCMYMYLETTYSSLNTLWLSCSFLTLILRRLWQKLKNVDDYLHQRTPLNTVQSLKLQRRRYVHFGYNRTHLTAWLCWLLA